MNATWHSGLANPGWRWNRVYGVSKWCGCLFMATLPDISSLICHIGSAEVALNPADIKCTVTIKCIVKPFLSLRHETMWYSETTSHDILTYPQLAVQQCQPTTSVWNKSWNQTALNERYIFFNYFVSKSKVPYEVYAAGKHKKNMPKLFWRIFHMISIHIQSRINI